MQHGAESRARSCSSQPEFASNEAWLYEPGSPFYPSRPEVVPVGYLCGQPLMTSFYYIRKWGKCVELLHLVIWSLVRLGMVDF